MKKLVAGAVACVGILLSVTACSSDEESPSTSAGGGQTQATTSAVTSILTYDAYGCEMVNTASGPQYLTLLVLVSWLADSLKTKRAARAKQRA